MRFNSKKYDDIYPRVEKKVVDEYDNDSMIATDTGTEEDEEQEEVEDKIILPKKEVEVKIEEKGENEDGYARDSQPSVE